MLACTPHFAFLASSMFEIVVPLLTSTPWSELKYGVEKSTTLARSSVIVTCESARSKPAVCPATSASNETFTTLTLSRPRLVAMSAAMQYSKPPLMLSGSSPFQNPGAGRFVATVSSPSLVSFTSPREPFATVMSQSPKLPLLPPPLVVPLPPVSLLLLPLSSPHAAAANTRTKASRPAASLRT